MSATIENHGAIKYTRAEALTITREQRRWRWQNGYKRPTFAAMFLKIGEHYYSRDEVLTCTDCARPTFDVTELDGEFRCAECASEYAVEAACNARHERLERTWSV
jgi:hypothetical protein